MFSLLVSADEEAWSRREFVIDESRYLEWTDDELADEFSPLDEEVMAELLQMPTLFAYETGVNKPAHLGFIESISVRGRRIRITYKFASSVPPISPETIDSMAWDLDIGGGEFSRTHWALKDRDLIDAIRSAGVISMHSGAADNRAASSTFSRATILFACEVLRKLGHAGLDNFLFEIGVDGLSAGRERGSTAVRCTVLAEFSLNQSTLRTVGGKLVQVAIVEKAIAIADRTNNRPPALACSTFRLSLLADGYWSLHGKVVRIAGPQAGDPAPLELGNATRSKQATEVSPNSRTSGAKIFLVHGRDQGRMHEVARFLEQIGLQPVILHERPNGGRTLISKFQEESADVEFAVVLMTPDDEGALKGAGSVNSRARQNVILELGFFIGKLGSNRVCALVCDDIERPSDFDGVAYVELGPRWEFGLARELREAGIKFNASRVF